MTLPEIVAKLSKVESSLPDREPGVFTVDEFAEASGLSKTTARRLLSEYKEGGIIENAGKVKVISVLCVKAVMVHGFRVARVGKEKSNKKK